jgi:hypothetical protein
MKKNRCRTELADGMVCGFDQGHAGDCGAPWKPWRRANYIPAPHFYSLNQACSIVNRALDGFGCYLVGSSLERRDYRDVDVRFIMSDEAYDRMFWGNGGWLNPLWSLMCTSISLWLSEQTKLPIDFQIQRQTQANLEHDGLRSALGFFLDYPGELPSTLKLPEKPLT